MSQKLVQKCNDLYGAELHTLEEQIKCGKHSYKDAFAEFRFMLFKEIAQEELGAKCERIFVSFDDFDKIIYASISMGEEFWFSHLTYEIQRQGINLDTEYVIFKVETDGTGIFVKAVNKP